MGTTIISFYTDEKTELQAGQITFPSRMWLKDHRAGKRENPNLSNDKIDLPCLWENTSFLDPCLKKKKTLKGNNTVEKRVMSAEFQFLFCPL